MIKNEWKALLKNPLKLIIFIAILLIPTLYSCLFLASMWDPYGDVENLPVAVVNHDIPVEYSGKELSVGEDLVDNLVNNDSMAFNVVDASVAEQGLKNGTYYMVITIPENFSANAATLMDEEPQQMILNYETNPGRNYIATKMSQSAIKEIVNSISNEITRTYAETLFDVVQEMGDGFEKAYDATEDMLDGQSKLKDGNAEITDNLKKLASSTLTFKDGSESFVNGLTDYLNGVDSVNDGAKKLLSNNSKLNEAITGVADGISALKTGSSQLVSGLNTLQKKLDASLTKEKVNNIQTAVSSLSALNSGLQNLNTAVNGDGDKNSGIDVSALSTSLTSAGSYLQNSSNKVTEAYQALYELQSTGGLSKEQAAYVQKAMAALYDPTGVSSNNVAGNLNASGKILSALSQNNLSEQVDTLKSSVAQLASASNQLLVPSGEALSSLLGGLQSVQTALEMTKEKDGQSGLIEGMSSLEQGLHALDNGMSGENGLVKGFKSYTAGVETLAIGLNTLADNNSDLSSGATQLRDGASQITEGAGRLADGSETLSEGLGDLYDGTAELSNALKDATNEIHDSKASDATLDMFSKPVQTEETSITTVTNNGHAMAAYIMSVALWVGCIAFCLMYPLVTYEGEFKGCFSWWASKASVLYPLAIVMSFVMIGLLNNILGFEPENMKLTLLVGVIASLAFMSILYFFNALLGKVGSFVMVIFMLLQLSTCAGTYPIELSGNMVKALNKYMPFTYSVNAFRSAISGGESIGTELGILLGIVVIFSVLTYGLFVIRSRKIEKGKKSLYQWIEEHGMA